MSKHLSAIEVQFPWRTTRDTIRIRWLDVLQLVADALGVSRADARRLIRQGAARLDGDRILTPGFVRVEANSEIRAGYKRASIKAAPDPWWARPMCRFLDLLRLGNTGLPGVPNRIAEVEWPFPLPSEKVTL